MLLKIRTLKLYDIHVTFGVGVAKVEFYILLVLYWTPSYKIACIDLIMPI